MRRCFPLDAEPACLLLLENSVFLSENIAHEYAGFTMRSLQCLCGMRLAWEPTQTNMKLSGCFCLESSSLWSLTQKSRVFCWHLWNTNRLACALAGREKSQTVQFLTHRWQSHRAGGLWSPRNFLAYTPSICPREQDPSSQEYWQRQDAESTERTQEDDRDKSMFLKMVLLFVNKTAERTLEVCVSPFVIVGKSYFIPVIFWFPPIFFFYFYAFSILHHGSESLWLYKVNFPLVLQDHAETSITQDSF